MRFGRTRWDGPLASGAWLGRARRSGVRTTGLRSRRCRREGYQRRDSRRHGGRLPFDVDPTLTDQAASDPRPMALLNDRTVDHRLLDATVRYEGGGTLPSARGSLHRRTGVRRHGVANGPHLPHWSWPALRPSRLEGTDAVRLDAFRRSSGAGRRRTVRLLRLPRRSNARSSRYHAREGTRPGGVSAARCREVKNHARVEWRQPSTSIQMCSDWSADSTPGSPGASPS